MDPGELMTISAVAQRCGIATSAIRYYEKQGLITSTRTAGNQRRYTRESIRRIAFITAAQAVGRSLGEIGDALSSLPQGRTPTPDDWSRIADTWRPRLDEQIARLVDLRDKLDACIGCGCLSLDRCAIYNAGDAVRVRGAGPRFLMGDEPD
ncbi:MAG: redox-sensitive transcriptional activator SoxR [Actinomycetota bacterium]